MKNASLDRVRFALTGVAAAALCLAASGAWALGLGRLSVQSALGEALRAEIDVTSLSPEEADNLRVRIAPPEAYRSAGVDYNAVLPATQAVLVRRADGRPYLSLTSDRVVQEPFVDVILELSWATGRLVREYTLLFDPPSSRALAAAPPAITSPLIGATPAPVARVPAPATAAPRVAAAKTPPGAAGTAAAPAARAAPAAKPTPAMPDGARRNPPTADQYRVRPGDTLSRIATRTQRPGASLDQMLVSLYRGNPQAFIDNNMNRLKAGVVLAVPGADVAKAVPPAEAREVIQAQSADFGSYRQRLAGAVPAARTEGSARQASGKVQATVDDRKQAGTALPDKLTLSKGVAAAKSAAEEKLSKEREQRDAATRVAELSKNVDELSRLSGSGATAAAAKPGAAMAASVPAVGTVVTASEPPVKASAPVVAPAAPPSVPAAVVASAPSVPPPPPVTVAPAPASAVVAKTVPVAPAPAVVGGEGLIGSLLEDNSLAFGIGGGLLALLAAFGIYRFTRRPRKDSGETSFLESRLQPDSFFGASGGQRIDTRESGASSSMSYSLSQLDAIGDVDPVAEADVYLAYGRDLQAEEILKEAMRSTPERMAIRTKLLEVYAKRRDTKGFELLATQLYALTSGTGEDWARAQEMGLQIDPDNRLYQPGGTPVTVFSAESGRVIEPLGASTMPQTVLPSPSQFNVESELPPNTKGGVDLDLDLDLDDETTPPTAASRAAEATTPFAPTSQATAAASLDMPAPASAAAAAPTPAAVPSAQAPLEFDLSSISLDLDDETVMRPKAAAETPTAPADLLDLVEFGDDDDPLSRKLELAEEFRQIGDLEGARDLLQEVATKGSGALKAKAQGMLETLG